MNRKWRKRLVILGGVLLLSVPIAVLVGKYWIVPSVLRHQASAAVREQWDGDLTIAAVHFNWTGPTYLRGIELSDAEGRVWLRAGSVKLALRNWPGLHPVLCDVEVENLNLQGFFAAGVLQLPLKPAPPQKKNEYVDLRTIAIQSMSIAIIAEGGGQATWDGIQLSVRREEQSYRIDVRRCPNEPAEALSLTGTVDGESLAADLALVLKHTVTREEAATLLAALKVPFVTQAAGRIDAQVGLRGGLAALSAAKPSGTIALADWSVSGPRGPLVTGLKADVRLDGQTLPGAVAESSASLCKGQMKAALSANALGDGTIRYRGRVDAENVSFDELLKAVSASQETRRGTLQFTSVIDGQTGAPGGPAVKGYVYLDDAGLADVPLLTGLFHVVGLTQLDALQATDVEAVFTMKGLVVTLGQARLANAVAAIDVEPGGQVDIERHHLDLYVIAAPIKQVRDLLTSIPFVKLAMHLKDRLTRLHIRGDWDAPPASLITQETLKAIGEGTVDFVRGAASTGGHLGKTLFKTFGDTLEKMEGGATGVGQAVKGAQEVTTDVGKAVAQGVGEAVKGAGSVAASAGKAVSQGASEVTKGVVKGAGEAIQRLFGPKKKQDDKAPKVGK